MELYRELAGGFIGARREHPLVRFEKKTATKYKNDMLVLSYLKGHGGSAHPKELSEEFMISTAQMAVILNQMEARELVVRLHDPRSHRQTIVKLTDRGLEFFDSINDEIIDFTARLFRKIGEVDARSLIRIIHKLVEAIESEEPERKNLTQTDYSEGKSVMDHLQISKEIREGGET